MVADVVSVIDALEVRDAWVVGHSMGGATGLLGKPRRPEAFQRAWVFEPIIFERTEDRPEGAFDFVEATKRRRSVFHPGKTQLIDIVLVRRWTNCIQSVLKRTSITVLLILPMVQLSWLVIPFWNQEHLNSFFRMAGSVCRRSPWPFWLLMGPAAWTVRPLQRQR